MRDTRSTIRAPTRIKSGPIRVNIKNPTVNPTTASVIQASNDNGFS